MHDSKSRTTDGKTNHHRKDSSESVPTRQQSSVQRTSSFHDETSDHHRKYMRTQSSSNNRVVSSSSSQEHRSNGEKSSSKDTKKPLRVFGDWSEFRSSSGKIYFYNCKTEISQWERPKGWPKDDSRSHRSSQPTVSSNKTTATVVRSREQTDELDSPRTVSDNRQSKESQIQRSSPGDESSRMSFSSTSSKESSSINTSLSQTTNEQNNSNNVGILAKSERENDIQRFYRAQLIEHLNGWPSTQTEKQCLKLFDDYYCYSAKISPVSTELKMFKSNFRVLDIKRKILLAKLSQCHQWTKNRAEDELL